MRAGLGMIAALRGGRELVEIYDTLETAMCEANGQRPTLDYPAALAQHLIGFDTTAFAPIFVAVRLPAWTAHVSPQLAADNRTRLPSSSDRLAGHG
jgi:citrate synthase